MEYTIIILILLIILLILAKIYDFNMKKLKEYVEFEEKKLNELTNQFPSNMDICKYVLNKLHNSKVKIEEDKETKTCLYIAVTDKIIIADVKNSYTRIQTICHECLHSIQNRKMLLFNFVYSNLYLLYFAVTLVLGVFSKVPNKNIFFCLMIIFSYVYYFIRSYLENDAMIKARYLAKEYMEETDILTQNEIKSIIGSYDTINEMGIKMTNYQLFFETIIKIVIVAIVFILK